MNRKEHLEWTKQRCFEYLDNGDLQQAIASFMSDMSKHDDLKDHIGLQLLFIHSSNIAEFMRFVDGFN
jgi:hypothetical protein